MQPSGSVEFCVWQLVELRAMHSVSHGASRHARCLNTQYMVSEALWRRRVAYTYGSNLNLPFGMSRQIAFRKHVLLLPSDV